MSGDVRMRSGSRPDHASAPVRAGPRDRTHLFAHARDGDRHRRRVAYQLELGRGHDESEHGSHTNEQQCLHEVAHARSVPAAPESRPGSLDHDARNEDRDRHHWHEHHQRSQRRRDTQVLPRHHLLHEHPSRAAHRARTHDQHEAAWTAILRARARGQHGRNGREPSHAASASPGQRARSAGVRARGSASHRGGTASRRRLSAPRPGRSSR